MARTVKQQVTLLRMIMDEHEDHWSKQMPELKKYRDAYSNRFWSDQDYNDEMIRIETADAYAYIESFVSSLFSKAPAVEVGADEAISGDPDLAKAVSNRFLYDTHESFINASRLALIYPASFMKLGPRDSESLLDRVSLKACPPWELVVDRDASTWEEQRFCGHLYYLSIPEAKKRFGAKDYEPVSKKDYFENQVYKSKRIQDDLPPEYLYIQVLELYDFTMDKVYFWSPNYASGTKILDEDVIPVRSHDDQPIAPIVPLYFSREPDRPMVGMSAMTRVYDQLYEKCVVRSYWANAVRRDSRQYLYREGAFDEEQLAQISSGVDGAMIGVDVESLGGLIAEVPVTPVSSNFDRYLNAIEKDLARGSMTAAFTRGEATMATATEVTALAQYTANEIGKLARERDNAIERTAYIYIRIISMLSDEDETAVITSNGSATVVAGKHLDSKFKISALDQGSQPIADQIKRRSLVELVPVLAELGVPPNEIRNEIVRAWDLPESFAESADEAAAREAAAAAPAPDTAPEQGMEQLPGLTPAMPGVDPTSQMV